MRQKLVDVKELSEMLSIRPSTIYKWVHEGRIPHCKLHKLVRFDPNDVWEWVKKRKTRKPSGTFERF